MLTKTFFLANGKDVFGMGAFSHEVIGYRIVETDKVLQIIKYKWIKVTNEETNETIFGWFEDELHDEFNADEFDLMINRFHRDLFVQLVSLQPFSNLKVIK
jgi:hypothetical protein